MSTDETISKLDPTPDPSAGKAPPESPTVRPLRADSGLVWLSQGWKDMVDSRFIGCIYGLLFVLMGYTISVFYATQWQLTIGLIGGFFLVGPFLASGIYDLSRQLDKGQTPSLLQSMFCWSRSPGSIALFSLMLTLAMIVWARVSLIIFALFSTTSFPTLQSVMGTVFSLDNLGFLAVWAIVGSLFAIVVFAIGAISAPMMLDRRADTISAVVASVSCLLKHPGPMLIWAALIALIIGGSLLLGFVPLIITAPLIGHATWRAYRGCLHFQTQAPD